MDFGILYSLGAASLRFPAVAGKDQALKLSLRKLSQQSQNPLQTAVVHLAKGFIHHQSR